MLRGRGGHICVRLNSILRLFDEIYAGASQCVLDYQKRKRTHFNPLNENVLTHTASRAVLNYVKLSG